MLMPFPAPEFEVEGKCACIASCSNTLDNATSSRRRVSCCCRSSDLHDRHTYPSCSDAGLSCVNTTLCGYLQDQTGSSLGHGAGTTGQVSCIGDLL